MKKCDVDVQNYSSKDVDDLILRFQNGYRKQFSLLLLVASVIFVVFYPTVLFEIPYSIKIYMFTGSIAVFMLWSFFANKADTMELLTIIENIQKEKPKATNTRGNNIFIYALLGILLVAYIIVAFTDIVPLGGLILLFALLFLCAIAYFIITCSKYIIRIKKNEAVDLYYGLYPELAAIFVFFIFLPVIVYPSIAEKEYSFTFTSGILVSESKENQTHVAENSEQYSIVEILKKYQCKDCSSKSPYVESEVSKTASGDKSIKLTTHQLRNSTVVDTKNHNKAVSTVINDIKKNGFMVTGNPGNIKAESRRLPPPPRKPSTLPTMYTLLCFIFPLMTKLLQSKHLMDVKKHYSSLSLQDEP